MSLVNDVLRDLERRKRSHSPATVHANAIAGRPSPFTNICLVMVVGAVIFIAGVSAGYFVFG